MGEEILEDIDGVDMSEFMTEEPAEDGEGNQTEPEEAEEPSEEKPDGEAEQGGAAGQEQEELFELKYNKETFRLPRSEVTSLAQKGMNYDKVLEQRESLLRERDALQAEKNETAKTLKTIESAAKASGMDVPSFLRSLRENLLVSQGMSLEAAQERMEREAAEEQLSEIRREKEAAAMQEAARKSRQERDIQEFMRKYRNVDPTSIPQSVWDAVRSGDTLVFAYGDHLRKQQETENESLKARIKALEQNEKNRKMSVGSAGSDGGGKAKDKFLSILMED